MRPNVHTPAEEAEKRKLLFVPLETKDALHDWIELFLGMDIPDSLVDEESTISPMGAIWEIYDKCRRNDDPDFNTVLNYASRMSFKTLGASILEVLMVYHLGRSVAHMAAIEGQAKKSQEYVKKFLRRPILREFVVGSNQRKVEVVRYQHYQDSSCLSPKEWGALPQPQQDEYEQISHYIAIVICTMAGANSEHVPFFVVDEVDVVANPAAYAESQAIPDTFEGKMPVTLLTSTRKFSFGLVQKEIDRAEESGLKIRHWNILDVTERCPEKRHRPDLPKLPIYRSEETLRALSEKEHASLPEEQQEKYVKDEGFNGCLTNCKLFAVCKGRLATHQLSTSSLLKKVEQTQSQFRKFSPEMAKAQLLCWKPSSEGLVYPRFDRMVHVLTAAQIAEKVYGEPFSQTRKKMTKMELIAMLQTREVQWFAGMDFGYTHNFAVVTGVRDGARMFILDVVSQPELDMGQMIEICNTRIKDWRPKIFADSEDPGRIKTLKRAGFRIEGIDKPKGSVVGGIEVVRLKLWPSVGQPELFFLAEDEGVALLVNRLQQYHWMMDSAGRVTNVPDPDEDDECDALRYLVSSVFAPKGKVTVARQEERNQLAMPREQMDKKKILEHHWNQLMGHAGMTVEEAVLGGEPNEPTPKSKGKKGGFFWDMG